MPPKPAPGKKGKDDLEDYTDVFTLPPVNTANSTIILKSMFSSATREHLDKYIREKLPHVDANKFKLITREELVAYAKAKQIILEPNVAATLPQDDPRLKMTEGEQLAKAACDKIFELSIASRRAKKEKLQKMEEEAKLQQQPFDINQATSDLSDGLDLIFNFVDFPQSKAEAFAMTKYNMAINILVSVTQIAKEPENEEEAYELQNQEQLPEDYSNQSDNLYTQYQSEKLSNLLDARNTSVRNSPLRYMYLCELNYLNVHQTTTKLNDQGEEIEERVAPEVLFLTQLTQRMEHLGNLLSKYHKFRERVPLMPLMPDKFAIRMIEDLKSESEDYHQWLIDNGLVEGGSGQTQALNQSQKSIAQNDSLDDTQTREMRKQELEAEKASRAQEEDERQRKIQELRGNLKTSMDDTRDSTYFKNDTYKKDFLKNRESKNCLSAIMSAMITQIANGEPNLTLQTQPDDQIQDVSTQPDSIDDLMDDMFQELKYDLKLESKQQANSSYENRENQSQQRQRKQGTEAFASQATVIGEVEYHEESDKAKLPLFKMPKQVSYSEEEKTEDICLREKKLLENLVLPGLNRHLMPQVPSKSQRIRDAEKPALYPFSTLPVEDAERAIILRTFQELLKSNFIDEGQTMAEKHTKYKAFERCFEQHMNPDILRQVLSEALLKEPDIATLYYPRNDALLVCMYNKLQSLSQTDGQPHNVRDWRAAYRVMPDFDNWVKYFADDLVAAIQQTSKDGQQQHVKYQIDDEMMPDQMLDIDDVKIQNINEKSQFYYPGDGSIMKVDTFSASGKTQSKSVVFKDNLVFGLRKINPDQTVQYQESEQSENDKEFGLYTIKREGDTEFWVNFENDTKLLVEKMKYEKNPQRLIRIDPPKPTAEEIAQREEAVKQAQALAAKNKNKNAPPVVIEEYKEPEPTWEPEPLDYLDGVFSDDFLQSTCQATITLQNGLIVRFMGNGDIVQFTEEQVISSSLKPTDEQDRVILRKSGAVVRHFKNRDAEVLFPNGDVARFNKQDMLWIVTNAKGRRVAKKSGISWDIDSIPCAVETDAVSKARMSIREDNVMTIQFNDGSLYCQHADGTLMLTNADGSEIRIEKEGFAPINVQRNLTDFSNGDMSFMADRDARKDLTNAKERAVNGYCMNTYLQDGTIVETYGDLTLGSNGVRHVFKRPDFTVISVDQFGMIDIISSNRRSAMNEAGSKSLMGQDIDYCKGIFRYQEVFNQFGVYHAFIQDIDDDLGASIMTVDPTFQFQYVIDSNLNLKKIKNAYYGSSNPMPIEELTVRSENFRTIDGKELEDVGGYKNPLTKHFLFPRLFVINSDGSGYEMLTKDQLEYYFRIAKHRVDAIKQRRSVMVGNTLAKTHYFVTRVKNMQDFDIENQVLKNISFPQNAQYALYFNKLKKANKDSLSAQSQQNKRTLPNQYTFRQIFEFQEFETFKQDAFFDDFDRFRQWKMSQVRYESEFGIVHIPAKDQVIDQHKIEDDEFMAKRIIIKILKERRNKRPKFDSDKFKKDFLAQTNQDEEINDFFKRANSVGENLLIKSQDFSIPSTFGGNRKAQEPLQQSQNDKLTHNQMLQESVNQQKIESIKKKQELSIAQQLQDIRRMINTPTFLPNYFQSKEGVSFTKNNPQKPPSQEMIMRMSQRINRSQNATEKANSQYEQSHRGDNNNSGPNDNEGQENQNNAEKESPIVALEPEDNFNKIVSNTNNFMGSQSKNGLTSSGPQASLYVQEKVYIKQKEQEQILKAEEYHVVKTKDFNVIGRLRQDKPFVKSIVKSQAQADLNEKFITTECIADRRVKISSMAPRQYINAPSIEDVRKQGQHQMILTAINKKQTFAELINQANAMVTSVLHDPLKRSLNVLPSVVRFGILQIGGSYELFLTLKNEDSIAQRVTIKPLLDKRVQFQQTETGPIAPGMIRKVSVSITSNEEGTVKETLQILTKTDIFKIPVEAQFLSAENYQREFHEQRALAGKTLTNSRVRNKLNDSIQKGRMSAKGSRVGGESINGGSDDEYNGGGRRTGLGGGNDWIQTTNSESKLPVIPQANSRPFEVDPKKNLKDLLKK